VSETQFVFFDVEHGSSTFIKSPNEKHILVDLGTGSYSKEQIFSPIKYLKSEFNIEYLNYLIVTHPHLDHIDDILNVDTVKPKIFHKPSSYNKDILYEELQENDKCKVDKFIELVNEYKNPVTENNPDNPLYPKNYGDLSMDFFSPGSPEEMNLNNHSIVTLFEYANSKFLITGDNEKKSWNLLKENEDFMESTKNIDVLLASHHGRESGFDYDIVKHFNPIITIVSDGKYCDTSASSRYSELSRGWDVFDKSGEHKKRSCLTTRSDGNIYVKIGNDTEADYLEIVCKNNE